MINTVYRSGLKINASSFHAVYLVKTKCCPYVMAYKTALLEDVSIIKLEKTTTGSHGLVSPSLIHIYRTIIM